MTYRLGIDLGTTFTAAAVHRPEATEGEVVPLGGVSPSVPSVVFIPPEGAWVIGEAATRRALTDPDRVLRSFKRRIGDETPLIVGDDTEVAPADVYAGLVRWVVDEVARREGEAPDAVVVTHPAGWGPHKRESVAAALAEVGLAEATMLPEPVAAAWGYSGYQRLAQGATVGVYDLGGGTFDAAMVTATADRQFELHGEPEGIDHLGGLDFDEAIFEHVRASMGEALEGVDVDDSTVLAALTRLRRECTEAKEALSTDTEVTIPVMVPGASGQVRLVRSEFEGMIESPVEETIEALRRALSSAEVSEDELAAVLLVGGSSRIPLVAEMVSAQLGRPVAVDADPKMIVALGAALSAAPEAVPQPAGVAGMDETALLDSVDGPERPEPEMGDPAFDHPPTEAERRRRRRTYMLAGAASIVAMVALAGTVTEVTDVAGGNSASMASGPASPAAAEAETGGGGDGGDAKPAVDPWTGEPVTNPGEEVTTTPGPQRKGAEPAENVDNPGATGVRGDDPAGPATSTTTPSPPTETTTSTPPPTGTTTSTPPPTGTTTSTPPPTGTTTSTPPPTGTTTSTPPPTGTTTSTPPPTGTTTSTPPPTETTTTSTPPPSETTSTPPPTTTSRSGETTTSQPPPTSTTQQADTTTQSSAPSGAA